MIEVGNSEEITNLSYKSKKQNKLYIKTKFLCILLIDS